MKIGVIIADFIPSSNVEFEIPKFESPKFIIFGKNSLLTSILSFKREEDILPNRHDTLVFRFNTSFLILSKSLNLKLKVDF